MHRPGPHLERAAEAQLGELDVLLVLLVLALDLDPGLQTHGEALDLLVDGTALDPHLALDDPPPGTTLTSLSSVSTERRRHPCSRAAA